MCSTHKLRFRVREFFGLTQFYCTYPELDRKQFGHHVQVRLPPVLLFFVATVSVATVSVATGFDGHFLEHLLP